MKFHDARWSAGHDQRGAVAVYVSPGTGVTVRPTALTLPGIRACAYDWVKRKLRSGRRDLTVFDEPHAVARETGDGERAWIEHAGVPEVGHEHAALDAGDQLGDG